MDPLTIAIHGRWSSNAILTYLAESPLQCMRARMNLQTDPKNKHVGTEKPCNENAELQERLKALEDFNRRKDTAPPVMSLGYVTNMISSMIHKQKFTNDQPYNWARLAKDMCTPQSNFLRTQVRQTC